MEDTDEFRKEGEHTGYGATADPDNNCVPCGEGGHPANALKVYCPGPIRGDLSFAENYRHLIEKVAETGAVPLTEVGTSPGEDGAAPGDDRGIYERDMEWLREADCVVAEVSAPSHGAGFEICYALFALDVPVLLLHWKEGKPLSAMLNGCGHPRLELFRYTGKNEISARIGEFLRRVASEKKDGYK